MRIGMLLLLLAAGTLSGCQRIFASAEADFATVDVTCVDAAIRQTPGVTGLEYHVGPEVAPARSHLWSYGGTQPAHVVLRFNGKRWNYRNTAVQQWGWPWSSHELEKLSPVAARVNAAVGSRCGLAIPEKVEINID